MGAVNKHFKLRKWKYGILGLKAIYFEISRA